MMIIIKTTVAGRVGPGSRAFRRAAHAHFVGGLLILGGVWASLRK
jgi:hypothetical protein